MWFCVGRNKFSAYAIFFSARSERKISMARTAARPKTPRRKAGGQKAAPPPDPLLVQSRDEREQRARSRRRRLHLERPETHRRIVEALGRAEPPAQGGALPLGAVDAGVLYQPRRQKSPRQPAADAGAGEDRIAQAVRAGIGSPARNILPRIARRLTPAIRRKPLRRCSARLC